MALEVTDHPEHNGADAARLKNMEAPPLFHRIICHREVNEDPATRHLLDEGKLLDQLHLHCRRTRTSPGEETTQAVVVLKEFQHVVHVCVYVCNLSSGEADVLPDLVRQSLVC